MVINRKTKKLQQIEIPKIFWKYYDVYRRKIITLDDYVEQTKLRKVDILRYLSSI
ncbi:MAG: hypothetical protein ACI39W_00990 [Brotaphodocola sp.]